MKIEICEKPETPKEEIVFGDLREGTVFRQYSNGQYRYYIKVQYHYDCSDCVNCIDIEDGGICHFDCDEEVESYIGSVKFDEDSFITEK